jgi:hypothetical protein
MLSGLPVERGQATLPNLQITVAVPDLFRHSHAVSLLGIVN